MKLTKTILITLTVLLCIAAGYVIGSAARPKLANTWPTFSPYDAEPSGITTFNNLSTGSLTATSATINGTLTFANGETINNAIDNHLYFSGYTHGFVGVLAKTANYTLTVADADSLVTNQGASGAVTITLPSASTGYRYCFYVYEAQTLYVDAASGDQIHALTNAAGDRISNAAAGSAICLTAIDSTYWVASGTVGTWADAN